MAAQRILRGEVPYADFHSLYAPGEHYLLAGLFRVFGASFDVASRLRFVEQALQTWLAWHVATRLTGSRGTALLTFAAGLALAYPFPSLALAFGALLAARRAAQSPGVRFALAAGAFTGLAGWFRLDVGAAAAAATAATILLCGAATRRALTRAALAAGCAAALFGALLAPALLRAPNLVWEGLVANPAAVAPYRRYAHGTPALFDAAWHYGAIAVLVGATAALAIVAALRERSPHRAFGAGIGVLAVWALAYFALRPDSHHLVPAGILAAILGASAVPGGCVPRLAVFGVVAAAIFVPLRDGAGARVAHLLGRRQVALAPIGPLVPGAATLHLPAEEVAAYRALIERVRALVPPDESFFSACSRHDVIHDQDLVLYAGVGRLPQVYDWHFDPGLTTREDVQRRLAADLERARVRVVVRRLWDPPPGWPAGGSRFLDDWLAARFAPTETYGRYVIWLRR